MGGASGSSVLNIGLGIVRTKAMALLLGPSGVGLLGIYGSIQDLARMDAGRAVDDAVALTRALEKSPRMANVLVGQFVDRRRRLHDYDDVRLESPWLGRTQTLSWEPQQG